MPASWIRGYCDGIGRSSPAFDAERLGEIADIDGESLYSCGTVLFR